MCPPIRTACHFHLVSFPSNPPVEPYIALHKHGLVKVPPPWSCQLILRQLPLVTLDRRRARVEDTRSAPTSRIQLRPWVLDRYLVPFRSVEASNRSRVRVSSLIPLYHSIRVRASVSLAGRASYVSSTDRGLPNTEYTSPSVGVFILQLGAKGTGASLPQFTGGNGCQVLTPQRDALDYCPSTVPAAFCVPGTVHN